MINKTCVITGGAGFIGANLTKQLLKKNYEVHILIKNDSPLWRLNEIKKEKNLHIHKTNINNASDLKKIMKTLKPKKIFHLASYGNYSRQTELSKMVNVNVIGTKNILEATHHINYDSLIITGSSSEYGFKNKPMRENDFLLPESYYAATKASATLISSTYAKLNKKPIKILRLFSVYGPLEDPSRLIPTIITCTIKNKEINITKGKIKRDFIYIEDVVSAIIKASNFNKAKLYGEIFNIGTGFQYTNKEVVNTLQKIANKNLNIQFNFKERAWDTNYWVADINKTQRELGWKPKFNLDKGLKKSYLWYRKNINFYK